MCVNLCVLGIAADRNGLIYFVDGTMIRKVDLNGIISTVLGSHDLTSARPLTCDTSMHIRQVPRKIFCVLDDGSKVLATSDPIFSTSAFFWQVRLEWPTDLAINPMDNSIYVLDNNVVLQITENGQVLFF